MNITEERFGKPLVPKDEKNKKRKSFFFVIIFLICAVVLVAIFTIVFGCLIRRYVASGQEETWAASVASYWGGIIGGVISGILTFLGVFYTIRYYKESDAQKERASVQLFLCVRIGQDTKNCNQIGFSLGEIPKEKDKQKHIAVTIRNIGNGFANTLVIHTGFNIGGFSFNKVIPVNDYAYTYFVCDPERIDEGLSFDIQYVDSMTNEYIQKYMLKTEYDHIVIECGYPQLLEQ